METKSEPPPPASVPEPKEDEPAEVTQEGDEDDGKTISNKLIKSDSVLCNHDVI